MADLVIYPPLPLTCPICDSRVPMLTHHMGVDFDTAKPYWVCTQAGVSSPASSEGDR